MRKKTLLAVATAAVLMALPSLPADMRSSVVSAHPGAHLMFEPALCRELRAPQPFDLRQEYTDSVPTGAGLVHQPSLRLQAKVVHRGSGSARARVRVAMTV